MPHRCNALVTLFVALVLALTACSTGLKPASPSDPESPPTADPTQSADAADPRESTSDGWQLSSGKQDTCAGDLAEHGLLVLIPGGSFDQQTSLNVVKAEDTPEMPTEQMSLSGAAEVSAGEPVRLNQPTTITFQVSDPDDLQAMAVSGSWAAYYNGEAWEYFPPDEVDL